jgi:hypothetical protein
MTTGLILKRPPIGDNQDGFDALEDGVVVGRIFMVPKAPQGPPGCGRATTMATTAARARLRVDARWRLDGPDHKNGFDRGYSCRAIDCWSLLDCCQLFRCCQGVRM